MPARMYSLSHTDNIFERNSQDFFVLLLIISRRQMSSSAHPFTIPSLYSFPFHFLSQVFHCLHFHQPRRTFVNYTIKNQLLFSKVLNS